MCLAEIPLPFMQKFRTKRKRFRKPHSHWEEGCFDEKCGKCIMNSFDERRAINIHFSESQQTRARRFPVIISKTGNEVVI